MRSDYDIIDRKLVRVDREGPIILIVCPSEEERRYLIDEWKIDEHTLLSALDPDELSRLEFEPEHLAIIFKRPRNYSVKDEFIFKVSSIGSFIFKDKLVVVTSEDIPIFDGITLNRPFSPTYLTLKLIYRSIYHFLEHLKIISTISDELQTKINTSMENRHLINLFTLEKSLVYYLSSISANGALIDKIKINASKIGLQVEEQELIDDIQVENNQCYKQAEVYSNILASLMDARASIVSNNLNVLIKTLNIITIAIMVPTFVVSAFSMNVKIPLATLEHAFWIIMCLALISVVAFLAFWRYRRW